MNNCRGKRAEVGVYDDAMNQCAFCFNAYVYAKIPKTEEELYFGENLDDSNDGSSCGIGFTDKTHSMYFNSGMGKPCNIEVCEWGIDNMWHPVAIYYPKFCPECGRKLDEYKIIERGSNYEKLAKENIL